MGACRGFKFKGIGVWGSGVEGFRGLRFRCVGLRVLGLKLGGLGSRVRKDPFRAVHKLCHRAARIRQRFHNDPMRVLPYVYKDSKPYNLSPSTLNPKP